MSDPLTATGTTALVSATIAAPAVGIDYGVIFGAFIGAMFYVTRPKTFRESDRLSRSLSHLELVCSVRVLPAPSFQHG